MDTDMEPMALLTLFPTAAILLSRTGTLLQANPAATAQLGTELSGLIGTLIGSDAWSVDQSSLRLQLNHRWMMVRTQAVPAGVLCTIEDHTELVRLERSERVAHATQRMAQVGGWELDLRTMAPVWSDEVCRIHGVPLGFTPSLEAAIEFYAPEARPIITKAVETAIAEGSGWDLELPFITADKRRIWVRAIGQTILEDGTVVRIFGTFQDITAQKRTELALRDALQRTRKHEALFESSNAFLAIADFDGYFQELNTTWGRVLGYTAEELSSRPFIDFVHPDDVARTIEESAALTEPGHETVSFTNRYKKKDGGWISLRWSGTSDTETGRIYAVAHDISEDLQLQQRLRRLAMIASRTNNAVLITDTTGHTQWINDAFTRITGYTREEIIGRKPGSLLQGPASDPAVIARMSQAIRCGAPFTAELINYTRGGEAYWVEIEGQPLRDAQGELTGFMAIETDITARKEAQSQLIAARDAAEEAATVAQAATHAKSAFLAMMSHELRTPMNGILGTAQLLAQTPMSAEQEQYVRIVQSSGRSLLTLLNDILDFSKIEADRMELCKAPFSLGHCLEEVTALYAPSAAEQGLSMRLELAPDLPAAVEGDDLRLRQVLCNLVGNALKFTEAGSITVCAVSTGPRVRIEVRDTGVGIAPEDQSHLFEAFRQLDLSAQRRFQGTGLGLAISHRLVALMGGEIGVESTPGSGSTFWIDIPLPEASSIPEVAEHLDAPSIAGLSVLLVEDNPINQLVASRMLENLGCDVSIVSDGLEAIEAVEEDRFSMVLMDCHMPNLDGWSATRALRAAGWRLPIVALTASVMPDEIARCHSSGMDDYLSKPLEQHKLHRALLRWSDRETTEQDRASK